MLYGGVIADRIPRRRMLLITQTTMMILAFILAALTFSGRIQAWHIIILALCLGTSNAFDAPARQAFVTELVDREDLSNAIALNSTMFNTATVLGPALAGITYAAFGPQWCFTINALSFIAVILALSFMHLKPFQVPPTQNPILVDLKNGFRYIIHQPEIRVIILNLGMVSLMGMGFVTLMPAWSVKILSGNAATNGYLFSARGFGALSGALMIASLGRISFKGKLLTIGSFSMPIFLLLFSFSRWLPISIITLMGVGWGFMVIANMSNTLVQTNITDDLRGRVMGIYTLTFFGLMPIGSLINGAIATRIGPPLTVQLNTLILLAFATLILLRFPSLRKLE